MKIYISGQITGLSEKEYEANFLRAYMDLFLENHCRISDKIIDPLDLKPFLGIKKWLCYMITDLYHLRKCTHIAMQPNWIESRGAIIEYYFAKFIFKLKIIWL